MREQNIKNLKTEKLGITLLRNLLNGFDVPNKLQLKKLYDILNIDYKKYSTNVDGVLLNFNSFVGLCRISTRIYISKQRTCHHFFINSDFF